jgi:hypothetical protein
VARKLLGGLHKDKIWALHHLRQLHEESQKEKKWQYCAALDSARSQALVSSIVKKLHRSILDPLNQVPQASMTRERLDEIRFAVQAVWNAEHELEQENDRQSRKELESSGAGTSMKEAFKRANGGESSQAA